nr:nucleotide-binding alpha-beta plait domain-containing protein [Tanacetum cinerariifolium]
FEEVPDKSIFEGNSVRQNDVHSEDPFGIYVLLNKKRDVKNIDDKHEDSLKYLLGFTPNEEGDVPIEKVDNWSDENRVNDGVYVGQHVHERVEVSNDTHESTCSGHFKKSKVPRKGGSILELIDDLVNVGKTMGYDMTRCIKNMEEIIESQGCPNMVLDETCLNHEDFSLCLLEKVKEFASLTNLKVVLGKEGYANIKLKYMGGFWVMIVFQDDETKKRFQFNLAVGSWFSQIIQAHNDFVIDERVIWVEVEGVPCKWWSRNTFSRIPSRWGTLLNKEELEKEGYHSNRICIRTKLKTDMFDYFKIVYRGMTCWVHVIEEDGVCVGQYVHELVEVSNDTHESTCSGHFKKSEVPRKGGSILELIDDLVNVGQTMGYDMTGSKSKRDSDHGSGSCGAKVLASLVLGSKSKRDSDHGSGSCGAKVLASLVLGGDSSLLGNRALNNSLQAYNTLSQLAYLLFKPLDPLCHSPVLRSGWRWL